MTMSKKKIMCLVLSLVFVVTSSQVQAQPGGSSNQGQAKTESTAWKFFHWRLSPPRKIVSAKASESLDRKISFTKVQLLSNEDWTPYATLGMIEHTKKIIEGTDSVVTNLFGICRQIAIANDGKYTRGISQLLEQFTSDKRDYGKVGEGIGYIIKGAKIRLYRLFIGLWQYAVSVLTVVNDKFFSSTDTHYTYKKAYNDLKESFKIIGAAIDVSPIGHGIKGSLMMIEAYLRKFFNLEFNDQNENNIYYNETLRTWRYVSLAIAPCISVGLYMAFPQLAVENENFIVGDIVNIISNILGFKIADALYQLDDESQPVQH